MQAGVPAPPGHPFPPPGRCFAGRVRAAWRGFERLSRGMRGGEWGVSQCLCPVRRSRSALRRASPARQLPLPRTQNKPMLRKENVPACISPQATRRSECESRVTSHEITAFLDISSGANQASANGFHESRDTNHGLFSPWVRKGRATGNLRPDGRSRRPVAAFLRVVVRHGAAMARHGRHIAPRAGVLAPSAVLAQPQDARRSLGIPAKCTKSRFPQENASSAALAAVPVALRAASEAANAE